MFSSWGAYFVYLKDQFLYYLAIVVVRCVNWYLAVTGRPERLVLEEDKGTKIK
jgi:hypothetical protein